MLLGRQQVDLEPIIYVAVQRYRRRGRFTKFSKLHPKLCGWVMEILGLKWFGIASQLTTRR